LCGRERQRQRDAAAKTVRQEAAAARRLEEVATNKFDEVQEMVSSSAPLGTGSQHNVDHKQHVLWKFIKCQTPIS
jgi:hypothetical protein